MEASKSQEFDLFHRPRSFPEQHFSGAVPAFPCTIWDVDLPLPLGMKTPAGGDEKKQMAREMAFPVPLLPKNCPSRVGIVDVQP